MLRGLNALTDLIGTLAENPRIRATFLSPSHEVLSYIVEMWLVRAQATLRISRASVHPSRPQMTKNPQNLTTSLQPQRDHWKSRQNGTYASGPMRCDALPMEEMIFSLGHRIDIQRQTRAREEGGKRQFGRSRLCAPPGPECLCARAADARERERSRFWARSCRWG